MKTKGISEHKKKITRDQTKFLYEYITMKQNMLFILILLLAVGFSSHRLYARYDTVIPQTNAPIVVELFTSQGCSSCPPADRIFTTLAKQDNLIALSFHVTYWNHLKWKDTLSQEYFDMRQHGYAGIKKSKRIFTPQMIVNGTNDFVGSHGDKITAALEDAAQKPIEPITIKVQNTQIEFNLPNMPGASYRLWAFGYKKKVTQNIGRGENSGRTIDYAHPVISYTNLGAWIGTSAVHTFDKPEADIDGIAILAQSNGYGEIVAAGKFEF